MAVIIINALSAVQDRYSRLFRQQEQRGAARLVQALEGVAASQIHEVLAPVRQRNRQDYRRLHQRYCRERLAAGDDPGLCWVCR
jgi:hypothetical protein